MWQMVSEAVAWNDALHRTEQPHVLQSWEWGEFKSRWGWTAQRWALRDENGRPRALMQVLRRTMGPLRALYVPKGPLTAPDVLAYDQALEWLERLARTQRAVWVKLDGDVCSPALNLNQAREVLRRRGWVFSSAQVQFRNTAHTDLQADDDTLLARMKPKWRYNIRLAERRGVQVRLAQPDDYQTLYRLYAETAARDGFIIREPAYYFDAWRTMGATGFIAEKEDRALAGLILFTFADRAWYFYGMSSSEGREHMPNHLLQWTAMRWARDQGCRIYDWWGAPEQLDPSDPLWGVYRFKEGFGAHLVEGLGAWDYAPSALLYRLAVRLYRSAIGR
ncbi:MAG: peptidoglycan bridge formation glycyltransferase FemA/FemB family protein [Anaerolineae bacterium]|nr:peptidoglycan bridge formation glycyltransferase FemA/FemB family protein [Thermoflexales bacterium]MDW8406675.1 peptidoglycan bridge formation glycyltransferase FemA/FemB family protein [Anaerolineae bacterium]